MPPTLIVADGFSCREQIAQVTDRRALHLAEVLQMALDDGPDGPAEAYPESRYITAPATMNMRAAARGAALAAGALAGSAMIWRAARHRSA